MADAFVVDIMLNACGETYETLEPFAETIDLDGLPIRTINLEKWRRVSNLYEEVRYSVMRGSLVALAPSGARVQITEWGGNTNVQDFSDLPCRLASDRGVNLARAQDLPERYVKKGELLGYILSGPPRRVRVVVTQDDSALVRERRAEVQVKIAGRLAQTWPAEVIREVPGGHDQLPSKALSLAGGGPHATDQRDPEGLKSLQRVFQFDLELPEAVGTVEVGTRVFVRFHHHAEPLAAQ